MTGGVLAAHPFVTAIPFFFPTLIIVGVIGIVIWRDRHAGPPEDGPPAAPAGSAAPDPPEDRTGAEDT